MTSPTKMAATSTAIATLACNSVSATQLSAMTRWQAELEQKQAVLGRIVDIGAELYAIACAVVYADTIAREHPDRRRTAHDLADLFARQARRRIDALFTALWRNDDDAGYDTAQKLLDGRFTWLEEGVL